MKRWLAGSLGALLAVLLACSGVAGTDSRIDGDCSREGDVRVEGSYHWRCQNVKESGTWHLRWVEISA